MKTKFFVKTAVVAMAAFGAFAFNGNTQPNLFKYKNGSVCTNVLVECSNSGNYDCKVRLQSGATENVWDLQCSSYAKHNSPSILKEITMP